MTNAARGEISHTFIIGKKKESLDFAITVQATQLLKQMEEKDLENNLEQMFKILSAMTFGTMNFKTPEEMATYPVSILEFRDILSKAQAATSDAGKAGNVNRKQRRAASSKKKKK